MSKLWDVVVILPSESYAVIGVNYESLQEILKTLSDAATDWLVKKDHRIVMINGIYGPAYFPNNYIFGFYVREPHESNQEVFRKRLIEVAERQTEAVEKILKKNDEGDGWKNV